MVYLREGVSPLLSRRWSLLIYSVFSFRSSSGERRVEGAGLSVFRGPDAVWVLEKRPPDPEKTELVLSFEAFVNSISTGAEGPFNAPLPKFRVIGSIVSNELISISFRPPDLGPEGKDVSTTKFLAGGAPPPPPPPPPPLPEFINIFRPRASLASVKSGMAAISFKRLSGGPIFRATFSIS